APGRHEPTRPARVRRPGRRRRRRADHVGAGRRSALRRRDPDPVERLRPAARARRVPRSRRARGVPHRLAHARREARKGRPGAARGQPHQRRGTGRRLARGARHVRSPIAIACLAAVLATAFLPARSSAELLVDHARFVDGLWLFPQKDQPRSWRYLPQSAYLSTNAAGDPQFSLTFFVDEEPAAGAAEASSIGTASGGAILHLLVEYGTPPGAVAAAQTALRRELDDDTLVVDGPVIFDSGTISVVSSVLTGEGARSATLVALHPAPVLEG